MIMFKQTFAAKTNILTVMTESNYDLKANIPQIINLNAGENTTLTLDALPRDAAYIVCQAHSQRSQLTLSTMAEFDDSSSVSGRDVGVVSVISDQSNVTWYLRSDSGAGTRVMVHATVLTANGMLTYKIMTLVHYL